jgi:membrane protein implicated in regulation of membrane protease activity
MIERIIGELGPWNWVAIGILLLAFEIAVPGVYLLWLGLAAIIVGLLSVMFANAGFWPWEAQIIVFLMLSLVLAYFGQRMMSKGDETDEPLLNQRSAQLLGRTATLSEPIAEGRGRIRLDDTTWRIKGPDLPAGTRVKVTSVDGNDLAVEAA